MKSSNYLLSLFALLFLTFTSCDDKTDDGDSPGTPAIGIGVFDLIYVNDMAIEVSTNPSLVWEAAIAADGSAVTYSLYADKASDLADGEFPTTARGENLTTNFFTIASPLVSEEEYHWYVVAFDANGESRASTSVFSFTTGGVIPNQPPGPFNLLAPTHSATNVQLDIALSWQTAVDPEGDPVNYLVFFGAGANATGVIIASTASTSTPANGLAESTTYEWQVMAADDKGNITWCNSPFSFTTQGPPVPIVKNQVSTFVRTDNSSTGSFDGVVGHRMAIMNGTIYDTGGFAVVDGDGREGNDVYSSTDGINWTQVRAHDYEDLDAFFPSEEHQVVSFNNQLLVFNGNRNTIDASSDGSFWAGVDVGGNVPDDTHWLPRHNHQTVVYNNNIYYIGGNSGGQSMTDVWVSSDGANWTRIKEDDETQWPRGFGHQVVVANGAMYLMSGQVSADPSRSNEVWTSTDGANWTYVTTTTFDAVQGYTAVVYERDQGDEIWIISGSFANEIWISSDGENWDLASSGEETEMPYRSLYEAIFFQDKIWVFYGKGQNLADMKSDIWTFEY